VGLTEAGLMAGADGRQLLERHDAIETDVRESTRTPPEFDRYSRKSLKCR
jgi:hypothetical protein